MPSEDGMVNNRTMSGLKECIIRVVPAEWDDDELEDLLATDNLFIDYFNSYLSLPSFPEPLEFNKETGGFEIINDAKKRLAAEIKAAVRSTRRPKPIYRPVHNHSYSPIPLIPIESPKQPVEKEIDTSFTVKSLNREQGIEWIKRERMPAFLESDCYVEYRLAKLVAQAESVYRPDKLILIKIDYSPPPKKEKVEVVEEKPQEDETEVLLRHMYVSLGNTPVTTTQSWISQAKIALETQTTDSRTGPTRAGTMTRQVDMSTGRPSSALSLSSRRNRSATSDRDSGVWSQTRGSLVDYNEFMKPTDSELGDNPVPEDDAPIRSRLFDPDAKPILPRPADVVCVMADEDPKRGRLVYAMPRVSTPLDDEESDDEASSSVRESSLSNLIQTQPDRSGSTAGEAKVFENIDELGEVIASTALKHAIASVCGLTVEEVEQDQNLVQFLSGRKTHHSLTKDDITKSEIIVGRKPKETDGQQQKTETERLEDDQPLTGPNGSGSLIALGKDEKDSDDDSLLNSDDDYEEGLDDFFHKRKEKVLSLYTLKGINKFKEFLKGTLGERNWNLWLDIERAKLIKDKEEQTNYLLAMRERYLKQGSVYELSTEMKEDLDLTMPSFWTLDRLSSVQTRIAEPLILYWAPRFIIKQQVKVNPDKYYFYHHLKLIQPMPTPYPNPPVPPLLPLRPKTCMPRLEKSKDLAVKDLFSEEKFSTAIAETRMPVGNRRVYQLPDNFNTKKEKERNNKEKKLNVQKTPRELIASKTLSKKQVEKRSSLQINGKTDRRSLKGVWDSRLSADSATLLRRSSSANSRRSSGSVAASDMSEFIGGRRMEGLLKALASEKTSGSFFRKHIKKSGNKLWKNCLEFWQELQSYHHIFYSEKMDPVALEKKARYLYSKYVVLGAPCSIQCDQSIRDQVYEKINPPFEELFDPVEEYVLSVLYDAWTHSLVEDIITFDKVEIKEVKRHLDTKSRYVISLQKRGIIKEPVDMQEESMDGYQDPVYDETLWDKIPPEFSDYSLDKLVRNRLELEHFRQFLAENYASMDLMCWMDIEAFRRIPHTEEKRRDLKAKDIKVKYFNKKYFFGPNSPAGREGQEKIMAAGGGWGKLLQDRPPTNCLLEAQKYVQDRLEKKWLPLFLATDSFAERQRPRSGMGDVVEDVMIQRKKRSQAIWKMLESKWVSSSKDILTFRKALNNPVTSFHFRRFLSAKFRGEHFFENDVLFWQEVQRYKDLCHVHSDRSLIQQKTSVIVNCFIDSPIPPSLQVDITQEMADKILERKLEATPYLFREAQLTVFRVLFTKWQDFCNFRSQITEDKIIPTLERLRKKNMLAEKKRQKELEEKHEKELRRRRELGLSLDNLVEEDEAGEYDDVFKNADAASEDGSVVNMDNKDNVTWSYSQYIQALDKEDVLNNVDEMTFSSLTLNSQEFDVVNDDVTEAGERESVAMSNKPDTTGKPDKEETSRKPSKADDTEKISQIKPQKFTTDTTEAGSQTDPKQTEKPQQRVASPKQDQQRTVKSDGRTSAPEANGAFALVPKLASETKTPAKPTTNPPNSQPRLQRRMPPLVSKPQ